MSDKTVHLVSNAHLDPMWLWEWEEGAAAAVSTFRSAADLCEEFDGFIFNHNESLLYEWVEEYEPELFERIKKLVKSGRWHIMGGWHIQPDCNMPSGESFIRQALIGKTYFKEKFGVEPTTALNFDSFGHTRGLVQILVKCGYDSYLFHRPPAGDIELPPDGFIWVGYEGSEVLAVRLPGYGSLLGKARERAEGIISGYSDFGVYILPWGVGDHGGGPSRQDIQDLNDLAAERTDYKIIHSTPEAYFKELSGKKDQLPKVQRDLNPWGVGCYTSQIRIKQKHRLLESELMSVEKMSTAAAAFGLMKYPAEELLSASKDLATCQFHDILPGSSIQPVEEVGLRILDHALETVTRVKARAFFALSAGQPQAKNDEIPVLVYNPHPYPVRQIIECEMMLADQNWTDTFTLTPVFNEAGAEVPSQNIKEDSNINLDWRKRVAFLADLKPSCMNRFNCRPVQVPEKPALPSADDEAVIEFDNGEMQLSINTGSGLVDRYVVDGVDYVKPGAFLPVVMKDDEDPWGMRYHGWREKIGEFSLMDPKTSAQFSGVTDGPIPAVRIVEDGPVRMVVEAAMQYEHSSALLQYFLPKAGTQIEVGVRVFWNEKQKMLKLQVPVAEAGCSYKGQVAFGIGELPANGDEAVAQKWVAVISPDDSKALTCINDGIYGSDFSENGLRLTLLRSPAYSAHPIHDRPLVPQDRFTPRIDQGERHYRFWFNAGPAETRLMNVGREAAALNERPFALSFFPPGRGENMGEFVKLSDDVVEVSCVKKAHNGNGIIVRLFEPTGTTRTTTLSIPMCDVEVDVELKPFEVVTLKIGPESGSVLETDMLER